MYCVFSQEVDLIREQAQKVVSLAVWTNLKPGRLQEIYKQTPRMKKFISAIE